MSTPRIHTYFEDLFPFSKRVLELFLQSWRWKGFEVVVHAQHEAIRHPLYKDYINKVAEMPCVNPLPFTLCSLRRWLAYSSISHDGQSVFLSDYDVINYSLEALPPFSGSKSYYSCGFLQVAPSCLREIVHAIQSFPKHLWDQKHNSDMTIILNYYRLPEYRELNLVSEYPDTSAPLVHFRGMKGSETLCKLNS